jgi:hypothetical protein
MLGAASGDSRSVGRGKQADDRDSQKSPELRQGDKRPAGKAAMDTPHIRICQHCAIPYDWRRSPSGSLKMTYCGSLCERADLGFTIETLLHNTPLIRSAWKQLMAA